ncbi:MAG TPA: outer membrane beta-barrel protein [Vicinamibacterales bacterium]|jgi:hypothetical protein
MKVCRSLRIPLIAGAVMMLTVSSARAQDPKVEIGASLASLNFGFGEDNEVTTFGVPSGGFGFQNPGVFVSLFVGPKVAIEPQIGLFVASQSGDTFHTVAVSGQVDYFLKGAQENSPYVFGSVGTIHASGSEENPVSAGFGAGYRIRVGNTLTFRFDGRYTHISDEGGNVVSFGVSIGGLLGR